VVIGGTLKPVDPVCKYNGLGADEDKAVAV
jgi:hypothetical protein